MKEFSYCNNNLLFWFRIWGYGLCFRKKKSARFRYTFSERYGYTKYIETKNYVITFLKPENYL